MNTTPQIQAIKENLKTYFDELKTKCTINPTNYINTRNLHNSEILLSDGSQLHNIIYDLDLYNTNQDLEPALYELLGKTNITLDLVTLLNDLLNIPLHKFDPELLSQTISNEHDITIVFTYTDLNIMFSIHYYEQ